MSEREEDFEPVVSKDERYMTQFNEINYVLEAGTVYSEEGRKAAWEKQLKNLPKGWESEMKSGFDKGQDRLKDTHAQIEELEAANPGFTQSLQAQMEAYRKASSSPDKATRDALEGKLKNLSEGKSIEGSDSLTQGLRFMNEVRKGSGADEFKLPKQENLVDVSKGKSIADIEKEAKSIRTADGKNVLQGQQITPRQFMQDIINNSQALADLKRAAKYDDLPSGTTGPNNDSRFAAVSNVTSSKPNHFTSIGTYSESDKTNAPQSLSRSEAVNVPASIYHYDSAKEVKGTADQTVTKYEGLVIGKEGKSFTHYSLSREQAGNLSEAYSKQIADAERNVKTGKDTGYVYSVSKDGEYSGVSGQKMDSTKTPVVDAKATTISATKPVEPAKAEPAKAGSGFSEPGWGKLRVIESEQAEEAKAQERAVDNKKTAAVSSDTQSLIPESARIAAEEQKKRLEDSKAQLADNGKSKPDPIGADVNNPNKSAPAKNAGLASVC